MVDDEALRGDANDTPLKIAFVSTYPPKQCGIGVFTADLVEGVLAAEPRTDWRVLAIEDPGDALTYPFPVRRTIAKEDLASVAAAAEWINHSGADVVSLQHEFGIWGGFDGAFLLPFLDALTVPVHATFHAVPMIASSFNRRNRLRLLGECVARVARVATFIPAARDCLIEQCGAAPERTEVIWHGAPPAPTLTREAAKARLGLAGRTVVASFGLLSRFKGLDAAIDAFAAVAADAPEALYLVLGQPHPYEPASLLPGLRAQAERRGIAERVRFETRFLSDEEIATYLAATDIYLTPYVEAAQISSGTLTRAMAAGCCAIATPYLYAEAALADRRGVLVPFDAPDALAAALGRMLADPAERAAYGERARSFAADLAWPRIGQRFLSACAKAALSRP